MQRSEVMMWTPGLRAERRHQCTLTEPQSSRFPPMTPGLT
jgi:hypothetical protein